ncbi:MAG: nucleotide exchange factor GrpE, partial [Bacteroidales bacterium]|nr:nucleotide exchange factor GrpE [Bacteroidales bacterium]
VKLAEINEKYLRLYSEFENYRKRTSKEKIDLISNASEEMIKDLLPVLDDYQRALDAIDKMENQQDKQTFEGLTLIYKKFYSVLENRGLKPINAIGEVFDENLHDAIAQLPAPKPEDKGKVLDETTKGYYLNDKVIRYSKVVVAI